MLTDPAETPEMVSLTIGRTSFSQTPELSVALGPQGPGGHLWQHFPLVIISLSTRKTHLSLSLERHEPSHFHAEGSHSLYTEDLG